MVEYSTDIAEYLGFCKSENVDLEPETLSYFKGKYQMGEKMEDLEARISEHLDDIHKSEENIWIITHGLVMSKIKYFYEKKDSRYDPLDYIVLHKNLLSSNQD